MACRVQSNRIAILGATSVPFIMIRILYDADLGDGESCETRCSERLNMQMESTVFSTALVLEPGFGARQVWRCSCPPSAKLGLQRIPRQS